MKITVIPKRKEYETLLELYPPVLTNKLLPDWYKKTKLGTHLEHFKYEQNKSLHKPLTIKNCPAIQDFVSEGIVIPLWGDLKFYTNEVEDNIVEQRWDLSSRAAGPYPLEPEFISYHSKEQFEHLPIKPLANNMIMKIQMPYKIFVPEGYNIYFTDPFYHFRDEFRCLPAIVEADKWGFATFPLEILKTNFYVQGGTPLIQCFIYKRNNEKLELDIRPGTKQEYKDIDNEFKKSIISGVNYKHDNK